VVFYAASFSASVILISFGLEFFKIFTHEYLVIDFSL